MTVSTCNMDFRGSAPWLFLYSTSILISIVGNLLTILAILTSRKLKNQLSNRFILSLAFSDLLVGCSLPYHMAPQYWPDINKNKMPCLIRFSLIAFACTSSICNLLMVAADRYIAIVHPFHYSRYVTRRVSVIMLSCVWTLSMALGSALWYWNYWNGFCDISLVPEVYLNYLVAPLFVVVWSTMLVFYIRIVREAEGQAKRLKNAISMSSLSGLYEPSRSWQMVFVILGCFTLFWFPYVVCITIIKTKGIVCLLFYEISFAMATGNSAMNPLIYAWKNHVFREAFRRLLTCRSPNSVHVDYVTNHVPSKANSLRPENGYCNGNVDDLMRGDDIIVQCTRNECDGNSEFTVESDLSASCSENSGNRTSYIQRLCLDSLKD